MSWRAMSNSIRARATVAFLLVVLCLIGVNAARTEQARAATPVASIDAGTDISCAVTAWGAGYCWGQNSFGAVGDGTTTPRTVPVLVNGGHEWRSISAAANHSCGVTTSGAGYCWGANWNYQLGDGTSNQSTEPVAVSGNIVWRSIHAAWDSTCGISIADDLYCWGKNDTGQLGNGFSFNAGTPWLVGSGWKSVATGSTGSCGLKLDDTAWCWGKNNLSQLGDGTTNDSLAPVAVAGGLLFTEVAVGKEHACGIRDDRRMYCWGADGNGSLANGAPGSQSSPMLISGVSEWKDLALGEFHTCGVTVAGALECAGYNDFGQLGDGSTTSRQVMTAVAGGGSWSAVTAGLSATTCGIKTDGYPSCWGGSVIGDGSSGVMRTSPTAVQLDVTASATVRVDVLPSFAFTVAAHAGACNGVSQTGTGSATAVNLGRINSANGIAAQSLDVATNAANGFTVFARSTGPMSSASHQLAPAPGTHASPLTFPTAGTEAFGFTTSDSALGSGTANRFTNGGARWAEVPASDVEVMHAGGFASSKTVCVAFQAGAGSTTAAGTYATTIIYTAVPAF
jgi:alpha-tubulin suppressor-like RCC1 family protein